MLVGVMVIMAAIYSTGLEPFMMRIRHTTVTSSKIRKNIRIAVLSDIHASIAPALERKIHDALSRGKPDLICIVGDLARYGKHPVGDPGLEMLRGLARHAPVIMVRGNGDICGERQCLYCRYRYPVDRLGEIPADILCNRSRFFPEYNLTIFGVDDPVLGHADMDFLPQRPDSTFTALLIHSTRNLGAGQMSAFDMICAGHTHGGQLCLIQPFLRWLDPTVDHRYIGGRYAVAGTTVIVSSGIGTSLIPIRFGVPPELYMVDIIAPIGDRYP